VNVDRLPGCCTGSILSHFSEPDPKRCGEGISNVISQYSHNKIFLATTIDGEPNNYNRQMQPVNQEAAEIALRANGFIPLVVVGAPNSQWAIHKDTHLVLWVMCNGPHVFNMKENGAHEAKPLPV
jgi:hypothetical protein